MTDVSSSSVPKDLQYWFDGGSILANNHGLARFEVRHRVIDVLANLGTDDEPYIASREIREFKTVQGAEKLRDLWIAEGRIVLLQHAPLLWLTDAELPEPTDRTSSP